jgi:hypothetical protein
MPGFTKFCRRLLTDSVLRPDPLHARTVTIPDSPPARGALARIYYRTRSGLAWFADRVAEWCDRWTFVSYSIRPAWLQAAVRRSLQMIGSSARVTALLPRVDVMVFAGPDWRVAYLGDRTLFAEFERAFAPRCATLQKRSRIPAWRVPSTVQSLLDEVDLVVCALPQRWPRRWQGTAEWRAQSPVLVRMVVDLDRPTFAAWLRGNARKRLRQDITAARRVPFRARVTRSEDEVDRCHRDLYLPHIHRRHGGYALLTPSSRWREWVRAGGTLQILEFEGRVVGAMTIADRGRIRFLGEEGLAVELAGTAAGRRAQVASKAFAWEDAFRLGIRKIDMGRSLARRSDPVFVHKVRWRAVPAPAERSAHPIWTMFARKLPPALERHLASLALLDYTDLSRVIALPKRGNVRRERTEEELMSPSEVRNIVKSDL